MRRIPARILLICILIVNLLPLTALADNQIAEPSKPYERVISKLGSWYSSHRQHENETYLVTGFTGAYETKQDEFLLQFELRERIKITAIHVPFVAPEFSLFGDPELVLVDNQGNIYSGFIAELSPEIRSAAAIEPVSDVNRAIFVFIPQQDIVLPAGSYTIKINSGNAQPVPAFLVRGYNYAAFEDYIIAMQKFLLAQKQDEEIKKLRVDFGRDFLDELEELLRQQEISREPIPDSEAEELLVLPEQPEDELIDKERLIEAYLSNMFVPPTFYLEKPHIIDEIILNTYNEGLGAEPGIVYIIDEKGNEVAAFQAEGIAFEEVPNALWVVYPSILLPAGTYYIDMSNQEVLGYDENLEPLFFVGASIPADPPINVTGTYRINLDVFLTSTLMGPVTETESSFSLEDFQLTVLDKGNTIELIGKYEDMPFSQNSEVIERTENMLVAVFNFNADLTETPYNASIGATVEVTILLRPGLMPEIRMIGEGTYMRIEDIFNMDHNTYDIVVTGVKFSETLPPFVMAAIQKAYGVGNIPGPATPLEAAAGILFPPLVGVVVSVIQDMLKPRVRDLAWYREKHPGVRDEILALMMMADALAASGGDPEDPISGRVSGRESGKLPEEPSHASEVSYQDSEYTYKEENYQYDEHYHESTEDTDWIPAQGDVVISEEVSSSDKPEVPEAVPPAEREYMVVRTGVLGSTTLIYRDPASGEWINSRTGNIFDLESHQRTFPERVRQHAEQRARNLELERTGQTSFQLAMREMNERHRQDIDAIQQRINERNREYLRSRQDRLEREHDHITNTFGLGRTIADSFAGAGGELVGLGRRAWGVGRDALSTAREAWNDPSIITNTARETISDIRSAMNTARNSLTEAAYDVYNNPEILLETIRGTGRDIGRGAQRAGRAVVDAVRDPRKAWEALRSASGIEDFEKAMDPNIPLERRIGHVLTGTLQLGGTIATAGKGAAVIGTGARRIVGGLADDAARVAVRGPAASTASRIGVTRTLPVRTGPSYMNAGRQASTAGVTRTSRTIIRNTADDFGVQIHTRPTTRQAEAWINSGRAVPKAADMKAKTLNHIDELIGGPKNREGLVAYFDPKLPPENVMRSLSREMQDEIVDRFNARRRDFRNLAGEMRRLSTEGKYEVIDGLVIDRKSGKFITGDVDLFDITNFDGSPVSDNVKRQVTERLMRSRGSNVMHGDVMSWNVNDRCFDLRAKVRMMNDARCEDGVITYNPLGRITANRQNGISINMRQLRAFLRGNESGLSNEERQEFLRLIRNTGVRRRG